MITICSRFKNLNVEKQKNIIDVALKEFAQNGFAKASTNEIVKKANISKGSLFNYFNSKQELYLYLLDYSLEIIEGLYHKVDLDESDLFKRIGNIGLQKLQIQQEFPFVFDFLASTQLEESPKVKEIVGEKVNHIYASGVQRVYENIDYSKFRPDLDIEKAIELVNWTMFGFGEKLIKQIDTFEDKAEFGKHALQEWQSYSDLLEEIFYK